MKEESQFPKIDPELEARIVALVLGEASDFERDELSRLIDERPELAAFKEEMQGVHGLLRDVASGESVAEEDDWKLSTEKRNAVLAVLSDEAKEPQQLVHKIADQPGSKQRRLLSNIAKIAAVLLVAGSIGIWAMSSISYQQDMATKVASIRASVDVAAESLEGAESAPSAMVFMSDGAMGMEVDSEDISDFESTSDEGTNYENSSRSSLFAIRDSLGAAPKASMPTDEKGASVTFGFDGIAGLPTTDLDIQLNNNSFGTTLPSPHYLSDDVQYFPAAPTVELPKEADAFREARETQKRKLVPSNAAPSSKGSDGEGEAAASRHTVNPEDFAKWQDSRQGQPRADANLNLSVAVQDSGAGGEAGGGGLGGGGMGGGGRVGGKAPAPATGPEKEMSTATERSQPMATEFFSSGAGEKSAKSGDVRFDGEDFDTNGQAMSQPSPSNQPADPWDFSKAKESRARADGKQDVAKGRVIMPSADDAALPNNRTVDGGFFYDLPMPEPVTGTVIGDELKAGQASPYGLWGNDRLSDDGFGRGGQGEGTSSGKGLKEEETAKPGTTTVQLPNFAWPDNAPIVVPDSYAGLSYSVQTERSVTDGRLRGEVRAELQDARRQLRDDPQGVSGALKDTLSRIETTPDLDPKLREELRGQVRSAIQIAGRRQAEFLESPSNLEQGAASSARALEETIGPDDTAKASREPMNTFSESQRDQLSIAGNDRWYRYAPPMLADNSESMKKQPASGQWATRLHRDWVEKLPPPIESESVRTAPAKKSSAPAGLNEKSAADEAFSTFSLHVSDVSFKLARAALARGEWPEAAKTRIEEFVNAFDYGDPMPSQSEKVACRVEQSIHPFLQQRNLLRVSMRTAAAGRASKTPLRLTFLLDNSGSMERIDRQQTVRRAFALLAQQLKPIDQVTLISFARQPRLLADKVSGADARQLVELIHRLPSEGGTNLEAALQLAFEKAQEHKVDGAQNRIILLTDGAVNLGNANPESLSRMITTMRGAGIAFDAAGISAEGLNDEILEALTRKGDGRYYLLDSLEAADDGFARQIAGALRPSAKNVKVQVEFNPKRVGRYKLLGFEKHRLKQEDFRNDKVDAAEMAAAEAGVAVYQFEAKPDGEGDVGSVSVRFRDLSTGQMIEHCWPIPYEADAPRLDQAAASLRIAGSAALLAAKLRGEPLGESVDLKTLSNLVSALPDRDRNDDRVSQLQQMIEQARQVSGE